MVRYQDANNLTKLEVDAGRQVISVVDVIGGVASERVTNADLHDFDSHAWHEYRLERRYCRLEIRIDGRFAASCTISDKPVGRDCSRCERGPRSAHMRPLNM